MTDVEIDRQRILDHRCRTQQLIEPVPAAADCAVLGAGVRDNPVRATAPLALRARTAGAGDDEDGLVRAYSVRSAIHLHRRVDLGLLIAALRWQDAGEPARGTYGELSVPDPLAALAQATDAARMIMDDGEPRTKGELSGAITADLDPALSPWCAGCRAHHLNDGLFRHAVFQAGLVIVPEPAGSFRIHPYDRVIKTVEPEPARRELLRRYLHLAGVATRAAVATWLGLSTQGARAWWELIADELEPVRVDGNRCWMHTDDLAELPEAGRSPSAGRISLLPPYDPYTDLVERKFLLPDADRRGRVWRAARNPGVVNRGGEVIGTWRDRQSRGKGRTVAVELFDRPARGVRAAVEERAQHLFGEADVDVGSR
jgi:hypothetical protein